MKTKTTKFEKEVKKELKKAKRQAMQEGFCKGMMYDFGMDCMEKPNKTVIPMMGISLGAGIGIAALETVKNIVVPNYVKYGINAAISLALPIKYGITGAIEAGKKFDELTTMRA